MPMWKLSIDFRPMCWFNLKNMPMWKIYCQKYWFLCQCGKWKINYAHVEVSSNRSFFLPWSWDARRTVPGSAVCWSSAPVICADCFPGMASLCWLYWQRLEVWHPRGLATRKQGEVAQGKTLVYRFSSESWKIKVFFTNGCIFIHPSYS